MNAINKRKRTTTSKTEETPQAQKNYFHKKNNVSTHTRRRHKVFGESQNYSPRPKNHIVFSSNNKKVALRKVKSYPRRRRRT